ncbi:molybdopterin-guanine dinucleotide biosynthesis protein A [Deinobacterium chartae]|uniref:Probable molybdenum cofactor guanylyltransferase n=1 Tax=Deinobacterium chartae TaxID=521158 RepID=A0A841I5C6_9DEIO|nr:molybdenum cofactor guanylyltransferase [Deinobacterium chartae]MBB6099479.1 molybdopterin-guanine dinucleotide biosynthesis protein A [Deinobacterium chartae]
MALKREQVSAAITAGGASSRFGSDKALARLGEHTLLQRVALSLEGFGERLLVAPGGRYDLPGWRTVPERWAGRGPLSGLEAALSAAAGPFVAFAAVDLPGLTPAYWEVLLEAAEDRAVAACGPGGQLEPLAALYPLTALPRVRAQLQADRLRLRALLEDLDPVVLPWQAVVARAGEKVWVNVNRPQDLEDL